MQILKCLSVLLVFICPLISKAQTTYLPEGSKENQFIDRLEIKQGNNTGINFPGLKPYSRRSIVHEAEFIDSFSLSYTNSLTESDHQNWKGLNLSSIDKYNLHSILMDNSEWVTGSRESFQSKSPILKSFYATKPNLVEVNTEDFFLAVNPVLVFEAGGEPAVGGSLSYSRRGITSRGRIANKIGFSTTITDNQERGPVFFQNRVNQFHAVPGVGFYKPFKKNGYDYFDARGYVTFNVTKYIDFQFGYDKNFTGNGYRSLFLSDFGSSYLFLKINTKIWKFDYQNLFMELMPEFVKNGDKLLDRKYAAMHHLSLNATKWLNVGLFESVVFGRKNLFDFEYLNPIIFLRHIEGFVGSPDNALAGADFKANVAHHFQFYGQLLLDEFILKHITKNDGYWANKFGYQLGAKYVDAFNIHNLDLQFETNHVRPFTYSHFDSVANYTHYNQPLAHPLGANFQEFIGILKYLPAPKWYINARALYYDQGLDLAGENFGSNPFELYTTRTKDYGYYNGDGDKIKVFNGSFVLSYELRENLFIEGSLLYRKNSHTITLAPGNSTLFGIGIRWNAARREYDY